MISSKKKSNLIRIEIVVIRLFHVCVQTEGGTNGRSDFKRGFVGMQTCLRERTNGEKVNLRDFFLCALLKCL
jgi:hypothetical protein